jgi:signal transduction histidine kinase
MSQEETEIITGVVIASTVFLFISFFIVVLIIYINRRKNRYIKDRQALEATFKQELLATRLEIQEETFKTISQEIHDNIGQALSFVKLNINTVDVHNAEDAKQKLLESKNQLSQTIQDLRDLAKSLNPDFLTELGLTGAIEQQLQLMQKTGLYQTTLTILGNEYKNQLQKELVIFRIVQELLNNIVKHAEATAVEVTMHYQPGMLLIIVADNGKGFDAFDEASANKGLGLHNMLNRMSLINGQITISSAPGSGTTARVQLPRVQDDKA